ncbi:MAG: hypothetical protein V1837_00220 [Candidatus Woesearchaeota archaeon]
MAEKRFFRCKVCGDIHFGAAGPEICPTCHTKNAYLPVSMEEAKKQMKF